MDKRCDHIPYQQSRLTHVLRDSLGGGGGGGGGNCHTLMVADFQIEETVSWVGVGNEQWQVDHVCVLLVKLYKFQEE